MSDAKEPSKAALVPSKLMWSAGFIGSFGVDVGLAAVGGPAGVASAGMQVLEIVCNKGAEEALAETEATLRRIAGAEERLEHLKSDGEELRRRLAGVARIVQDAGRHPEEELRRALGRFAARVLVQDVDRIEMFEIADALARMTFLDYAVLEATGQGFEPGTQMKSVEGPLGRSVANVSWLHARVAPRIRGLERPRATRSVFRLESLALVHRIGTEHGVAAINRGGPLDDTAGWELTALGRRVLEVTEEAGSAPR